MREVKGEDNFLKSLGFPSLAIHPSYSHFDFTQKGRIVLLIGPMGSGKTEFAARIWRDALIAQQKGEAVQHLTTSGVVDRREIFFIRSVVDTQRFVDYPSDALAYRGGYISCGDHIAHIKDSYDLEEILKTHPTVGTFIIDESSFFDERLAYVAHNLATQRGVQFIFPTLVLNFRKEMFNVTSRLMIDIATDVIPLTAYCEHPDCLNDAFYTYRYYTVNHKECPALYFDPLVIVGGDTIKEDPLHPNYCARCDLHHHLPAKEYTYFTLKPLGERASGGEVEPLYQELKALHTSLETSELYRHMSERYESDDVCMNSLLVSHIAERALMYLFSEHSIISETLLVELTFSLQLDRHYMSRVLEDNRKVVNFNQIPLL